MDFVDGQKLERAGSALQLVRRMFFALVAVFFLGANLVRAAEAIPPKPAGYFNDYANVVSKGAALRFNEQLAQFERETSNQVLVAVFRKMESDSSIEDYTQRVAQAWGVGKKDRRNGAVLFVFIDDRKMYLQVGYGLEGVLPDVTAFDITERHIKPHFKKNDYEGGLATGIDFICKAIRGEYTGTGKTQAEERDTSGSKSGSGVGLLVFIVFLLIYLFVVRRRRGAGYGYSSMGGPFLGGWSSGGGSSSSSSGGGFSGFGGGGGSFGGGGGGSSW